MYWVTYVTCCSTISLCLLAPCTVSTLCLRWLHFVGTVTAPSSTGVIVTTCSCHHRVTKRERRTQQSFIIETLKRVHQFFFYRMGLGNLEDNKKLNITLHSGLLSVLLITGLPFTAPGDNSSPWKKSRVRRTKLSRIILVNIILLTGCDKS